MSQSPTEVLILDSNQRSSLAVVRSIGAMSGVKVSTADSVKISLGGCSKYSSNYYQHPSISQTPNLFISWLEKLLLEKHFDIIFPCTEISSQLLLIHPSILGSSKLPFAPLNVVMSLANKGELTKLAKTINVKCPKSIHFQTATKVNPDTIKNYPIVIKPYLSQLWRGSNWDHTVVTIAKNKQHLVEILQQTPWIQNDPFMLQEFIPGHGAGIFAIYDNGKAVAFFAHQRLREKPPQGGVSVLSKSAPLDPKLLEPAKKLLDAVNWHGVAMVEFRISEDGIPFLMEVNTRFWGSLQLAIDAGVNFPKLLYQITQGETVATIQKYNINNRLRWFLGDFDSLYLVLKSTDYSLLEKIKRLSSFIFPHFFSTKHQVGRWNDLRPALLELKQYVNDLRK